MLGVIVNTITVIVGSIIGLVFKKFIPKNWGDFIMKGIALCVLYIGIDGALGGSNPLIAIISMAVGALLGTWIDLDKHLNNFANKIEEKFKKRDENGEIVGGVSIAEGFVSASLLFCVGAMTIVGSLNAGLQGDNTMLFTKATLDGISSIILSATLGIGVLLAAAFVFVFQGALVLLAQAVAPVLTDICITEMTCVGSLLILAIGLNMLGVTKLKVMNYMPAVFLPIILCLFM